jgi:histidine triad (HIT) family protein
MNTYKITFLVIVFCSFIGQAQSKIYQQKKADKIAKGSVFTKIINKKLPETKL